MKKKVLTLCICFMMLFSAVLLASCGRTIYETEKRWSQEGAWTEIYVYKGKGQLLSMKWSAAEKLGTATIMGTDLSYTEEYISLYEKDSNYKTSTTGLPSYYSGEAKAFETLDGRLWVRIIWSETSTHLLVRIYD